MTCSECKKEVEYRRRDYICDDCRNTKDFYNHPWNVALKEAHEEYEKRKKQEEKE